jgi:hypothetical protein
MYICLYIYIIYIRDWLRTVHIYEVVDIYECVCVCVWVSVCLSVCASVWKVRRGWALHVGHFCRPDSSMQSNQKGFKKWKVPPIMFNNSNWYIVNHWAPVCHSQIHPRWDLTTGSEYSPAQQQLLLGNRPSGRKLCGTQFGNGAATCRWNDKMRQ